MAARHFGGFAAVYSAKQLDAFWLCRGFLADWVDEMSRHFLPAVQRKENWQHRRVRALFPASTPERLLALYADAKKLAEMLESLPQTLCHNDTGRANLFSQDKGGTEETVAIDWSFVGIGAVGEDLGTMIGGNIATGEIPIESAGEYVYNSFEAYLSGLDDFGWHGKASDIRTTMFTAAALRHATFTGLVIERFAKDEPDPWIDSWAKARSSTEDEALAR